MKTAIPLIVGALGLAWSATGATTLYWTGAAETEGTGAKSMDEKGNWALVDGAPATSAPVAGDTLVFTNTSSLLLTSGKNVPSYKWRFEGKGSVTGPGASSKSNRSYVFDSDGGVWATGGGSYYLDYTVNFKAGHVIPVHIEKDSTVWATSYGTPHIEEGTTLVKTGGGDLRGARLNYSGKIRLEEGRIYYAIGNYTNFTKAATLEVRGPGAKTFGDDNELTISHYSEDAASFTNISFKAHAGGSFHPVLTLTGEPGETLRCSADVGASANSYQLRWDPAYWTPGTTGHLALVGRDHSQARGKIYIKNGTASFSEGAQVSDLLELRVGTGTQLDILPDAGGKFQPRSLVVEEGGRLVLDAASEPIYSNVATNTDFWPKEFTWNGEVELKGPRRLHCQEKNYTFGANASLKITGTGTKLFHTHGGQRTHTIAKYAESPEAEESLILTSYTASHNEFVLHCSEDTRFTANIHNTAYGTYALVWNPTDATKTLTVAKRNFGNDRPRFRVKKGTMKFAEGASISGIQALVTVEPGATFEVASSSGIRFSTTTNVLVDATATLRIGAGVTYAPAKVTVAGETVPDGVYRKGDLPWLDGDGMLVIIGKEGETETATWTGGGATAAIDDPANWGGTLPNLTNGSLVATFPAGASCGIDSGYVAIKGIVANGPGVTVTGGGLLLLGSEGVKIAASSEKTYCDLRAKVYLTKTQTWTIGSKSVLRIQPEADIIPLAGDAPLTIKGDVEHRATLSCYDCGYIFTGGTQNAYADNCFGIASAWVLQQNKSYIVLHGCSLDSRMRLQGQDDTNLYSYEGDNTLNSRLYVNEPNRSWIQVRGASTLTLRGSVQYNDLDNTGGFNNGASISLTGAFRVWVKDKPVDIVRLCLGINDKNASDRVTEFHLGSASNKFSRGLFLCNNVTAGNFLYTEVPYALYPDGTGGVSFSGSATKSVWDMCGCDQGVSVFFSRCVGAKVTSAKPATLHLVDDALNYVKPTEHDNETMPLSILGTASQVDRSTFDGLASFSKEGILTHYMMGASTSTGTVTVTKGRLIFTRASSTQITLPQTTAISGYEKDGYVFTPLTGSWTGAKVVNVTGGTLELQHGRVFSKVTDISVSGEGKVELASGVSQKCHGLTIDGVPCETGTWGGPDSDAENKSACLVGTGKLRVVGEGLGSVVILR